MTTFYRIFKINDRIVNKNNNKSGIIKDVFILTIDNILYYIIYDDKTYDFLNNSDLDYLRTQIDII
jgi:hypothetical protein